MENFNSYYIRLIQYEENYTRHNINRLYLQEKFSKRNPNIQEYLPGKRLLRTIRKDIKF